MEIAPAYALFRSFGSFISDVVQVDLFPWNTHFSMKLFPNIRTAPNDTPELFKKDEFVILKVFATQLL